MTNEPIDGICRELAAYVILAGNPIDGLSLIGPFESANIANEYGDMLDGEWLCAELHSPTEYLPEWAEHLKDWREDDDAV